MAKIFQKQIEDFKFVVKSKRFVKSERDKTWLEIYRKGKKTQKVGLGAKFNERDFKVFMGENQVVLQYPVDDGYAALELPELMNENFYQINIVELDKKSGAKTSEREFVDFEMHNVNEYFNKLVKENTFSLDIDLNAPKEVKPVRAAKVKENNNEQQR